jgi:hypothetical protein
MLPAHQTLSVTPQLVHSAEHYSVESSVTSLEEDSKVQLSAQQLVESAEMLSAETKTLNITANRYQAF